MMPMQKIAVYCRVSTEKEDQINSMESQKAFFRDYIERNPAWELFDIYADEGITGTSTRRRHSFHKMMEDAKNHKFNLIITKEISRFARNTLDSIYFTRKLKELGIPVIFLNDNINTLDADAELRLTIMSSFAQEESRKTSERVKWGQRRRMEQGIVFGRDMLGYDVRNGRLIVNEEGAKVVQKIFHKFVNEGKGTYTIARELIEEGIPTCSYIKEWSNVVIQRILKNEKYAGDLIQKKTYTPNYLTHEKKYNRGEEDFIIIHNHHEPIISHEVFNSAKQEMIIRSSKRSEKKKYSNRYIFSSKILCGCCGNSYVARTKKHKDDRITRSWKCYEAVKHGTIRSDGNGNIVGCNSPLIKEEELKLYLMKMVKGIHINKETIQKHLIMILKEFYTFNNRESDIDNNLEGLHHRTCRLNEKKLNLIELHLSGDITRNELIQLRERYDKEIEELNHKIQDKAMEVTDNNIMRTGFSEEISEFLLHILSGDLWDDTFYHNLLDKIIVTEQNTLEVYFKI